ncbi:hypothetical protein BDQ17DRAFT_1322014 [Cyathus striatus]|nr:hypothetical protein BDQ17DRAFT_1322014 [Cyathus striatus]
MPLLKNNKRARIEVMSYAESNRCIIEVFHIIQKTFLDIKAKVASDSEGKEDDENTDRFINDEDEDEEDPNTPIVRLTLQCSLYTCLQNKDKKQQVMDHIHSGGGDLFASLQAGQCIDNHHELINDIVTISYIGAVLPDWALWDVAVKDGSEEDMVFSLSLHGSSKYIRSAFSLLELANDLATSCAHTWLPLLKKNGTIPTCTKEYQGGEDNIEIEEDEEEDKDEDDIISGFHNLDMEYSDDDKI